MSSNTIGYTLADISFSVHFYNGQWCYFAKHDYNEIAHTPEQLSAINDWIKINKEKYNKGMYNETP